MFCIFFFSSRRRHTRCALETGVQTCALPICLTRGLMQLRAAAEEAQTLPGTGLDRLRAFLRSYADVNMRDFGKSVIRTGEEALAPESAERLREMKREIDAALRNLVDRKSTRLNSSH